MRGMCLQSVMWMRQKNSCRNVRLRWCMRMRHMRYPLRSRIRRSDYGRARPQGRIIMSLTSQMELRMTRMKPMQTQILMNMQQLRANFQQNRLRKMRVRTRITTHRSPRNRKISGTISSFTNTACKRSMSRWLYISSSLMMERLRQPTAVLSLTLRS